jgi:uncharacterized membrane protein YgaE (UPF0421/DUF939 family)
MKIPGRTLLAKIGQRELESWREAAASAIAAALAWVLAQHLFGHPLPLFAAISAIVCLAPGLPSHVNQAIGLLIGVATGILVGEVAFYLPAQWPVLRIGVSAFFAIFLASAYGLGPVVPIQSGVSAILVLTLGSETGGPVRMLDVAVGAGVGLLFSQVLFTPSPTQFIDRAARDLFDELALGLRLCAEAVRDRDLRKCGAGLRHLSAAHQSVDQLNTGIQKARAAARWSLRGRLAAREVAALAQQYERNAVRLYASALLLGEAIAAALRESEGAPPKELYERIKQLADRCAALAGGHVVERAPESELQARTSEAQEELSTGWQPCPECMRLVEEALAAFEADVARAGKAIN